MSFTSATMFPPESVRMTPHKASIDGGDFDNDRDRPTMCTEWLLSSNSGVRTIWPYSIEKVVNGSSEDVLVKYKSTSAHQI